MNRTEPESFRTSNPDSIRLGNSDLVVSRIALGCWPMAGITSLNVNDTDSIATIERACELGVNFFDSAYSYGYDGRSDRLLATALKGRRSEVIIASKVGMYWDADRNRQLDGSRQTLMRHAEECLQRLDVDCVDLMYLHTPDPNVPIEKSAEAIQAIVDRGWARFAGVSNVKLPELQRFCSVCRPVAVQTYFNMFQQDSVAELRAYCSEQKIGMVCYWVLMKGLLAGNLRRDHVFDPHDRRLTYPIFQGQPWERAQNLLDGLRAIARETGRSVSQVVVAWTLHQQGVQVALIGAKKPAQIGESSAGGGIELTVAEFEAIDRLIALTTVDPA